MQTGVFSDLSLAFRAGRFDIVASMPSALFISAGGYHHHIGMNVWHSRGAGQPPANSVRLRAFTIELPSEDARATVLARLEASSIPTRDLLY